MFNQALTVSATLFLWTPSVGAQQSLQHAAGARQEAGMMANCMMHTGGMDQNAMDMMSGDMGMMPSSAPGPAMLIRMGQMLDLSEKQIAELETIQAELADDRASHMPLVMEAHRKTAEWIAGGGTDLAAYEETLREATDHMISVHVSVARAALDARAVLTDEQRARFEGGTAMMRHMESMMDGAAGDVRSGFRSHPSRTLKAVWRLIPPPRTPLRRKRASTPSAFPEETLS